jgi:L-lactate dehydrogenase complex protein LldG
MVAAIAPRSVMSERATSIPRDEVLARIRTALGRHAGTPPRPGHEAPVTPQDDPDAARAAPAYRTQGTLGGAQLLDLLAERLVDYHASVRRATPASLAATVAAALAERGARRVVVPPGLEAILPPEALPPGIEAVTDDGLSAAELDAVDGVITGITVAIAQTGTVILDGTAGQGRRAITLVPDYHLCIAAAEQVVELVPEAVDRLASVAGRPLTWISGPSATSDIELARVVGVHGPRNLEVILIGES